MTELAASDYRVRELVARVDEPQNLVSYHLRLLRDGGLVSATRSTFDGRDSYYHLDLDRCSDEIARSSAALHPALARPARQAAPPVYTVARPPAVLFVCTGNSARSPIAEALLRHRGEGRVSVVSAGTRPKQTMHPNTVRVLRESFGIDIRDQQPRALATVAGRTFDHIITLCDRAREACAEFHDHPRRAHWSIPDPASAGESDQVSYPAFERTAAEIDTRIRYLLPILATL